MSHPFQRRLLKEHKLLAKNTLPGVHLISSDESLQLYLFGMLVAESSLYNPQDVYKLQVTITKEYPVDSPLVKFVINDKTDKIPIHPHIYSNGHICLNLLGEDWTPASLIETILLSIQSMLAQNKVNERPPDDEHYVRSAPNDPKRTRFVYHDDNV